MEAWSPTSFFNRRAYGSENLSPIPQKDFCNSICQKQTFLLAQSDGRIDVISLCDANEGALYR
jgi:hypothetical protein